MTQESFKILKFEIFSKMTTSAKIKQALAHPGQHVVYQCQNAQISSNILSIFFPRDWAEAARKWLCTIVFVIGTLELIEPLDRRLSRNCGVFSSTTAQRSKHVPKFSVRWLKFLDCAEEFSHFANQLKHVEFWCNIQFGQASNQIGRANNLL